MVLPFATYFSIRRWNRDFSGRVLLLVRAVSPLRYNHSMMEAWQLLLPADGHNCNCSFHPSA